MFALIAEAIDEICGKEGGEEETCDDAIITRCDRPKGARRSFVFAAPVRRGRKG